MHVFFLFRFTSLFLLFVLFSISSLILFVTSNFSIMMSRSFLYSPLLLLFLYYFLAFYFWINQATRVQRMLETTEKQMFFYEEGAVLLLINKISVKIYELFQIFFAINFLLIFRLPSFVFHSVCFASLLIDFISFSVVLFLYCHTNVIVLFVNDPRRLERYKRQVKAKAREKKYDEVHFSPGICYCRTVVKFRRNWWYYKQNW